MLPTITWKDDKVVMIDQRILPAEEKYVTCEDVEQVARAIETMVIRGAPAIGVAAAYGVALGVRGLGGEEAVEAGFERVHRRLERTRPTAVNLFWALKEMRKLFDKVKDRPRAEIHRALLDRAREIDEQDVAMCRSIGAHGRTLIEPGWTILTHCNAGALATSGYGTALGVIRAAHEAYGDIRVYADETRPFLQGARLTCWELARDHIPVTLITDNMAGALMRRGEIDAVVVGADRIAANGDAANKIGTYSVAVLARENDIPFFVAAPLNTVDFSLAEGSLIPIEERDPDEVRTAGGCPITLPDIPVRNPAFDVTPAGLIAAVVTERGVARPPFSRSLAELGGSYRP